MTNPDPDSWDKAIARRLQKLGRMPVELHRLRQRIESEIPPPAPVIHLPAMKSANPSPSSAGSSAAADSASTDSAAARPLDPATAGSSSTRRIAAGRSTPAQPPRQIAWARRLWQGVAALLIIGIGMGILLTNLDGQPAMASTAMLAELHNSLASGQVDQMPVDSIDQANHALSQQHHGMMPMPAVQCDKVMSCCIRQVGQEPMATALLMQDGQPVTLAVARLDQMRPPQAQNLTVDGVTYRVSSADGIQMVMKIEKGNWICLMGRVPADTLIRMAQTVQLPVNNK